MDKQIKTPERIKIIAIIMFIGSLCVLTWFGIYPPILISVIIGLLFIIGGIGLLDKQIKAPKGIKIIAVMMFIGSLCVIPWFGIHPILIPVIISLLFIIGGIGLWKMKRWGLILSCLALSGVISLSTTWAIICVTG